MEVTAGTEAAVPLMFKLFISFIFERRRFCWIIIVVVNNVNRNATGKVILYTQQFAVFYLYNMIVYRRNIIIFSMISTPVFLTRHIIHDSRVINCKLL